MRTFRSLAIEDEYARTQADFVAAIDGVATETRSSASVTIAAFLAHYPKAETVRIDRASRDVIVLGCIEEPDALVEAIADIAKAAKSLRDELGVPAPMATPTTNDGEATAYQLRDLPPAVPRPARSALGLDRRPSRGVA